MLEEVKRKEVDKRDKQLPQSFEQLIQMYNLDKIWEYLEKIVNFANNEVPEELETIQNNIYETIENTKATELYYNNTASYVSATLNDDITNYDIITVIGQSTDGYQCSTTIYKPYTGAKIGLFAPRITNNIAIYNKQAVYEFSSTNVLQSIENHQLQGNTKIESGNFIKLKAVLGYKL